MTGDRQSDSAASIDNHVGQAVATFSPGAVFTRYLLVAEVIDEDGDKAVVTIWDDNAAPWDTYALARMAIAKADAAIAQQDGRAGGDPD